MLLPTRGSIERERGELEGTALAKQGEVAVPGRASGLLRSAGQRWDGKSRDEALKGLRLEAGSWQLAFEYSEGWSVQPLRARLPQAGPAASSFAESVDGGRVLRAAVPCIPGQRCWR
jgi:hypothetical protein